MAKSSNKSAAVETPAVETPPTPGFHLLPLSLAGLADQADGGNSASRFALNGVRVEFGPGNTYTATATDTKVLVHVEGECVAEPEEYPTDNIPAMAHAPNGATLAMIPASFWKDSFRKAKTLTRRSRGDVLKSVAVVTGPTSTTMAATDLEKSQCDSSPNLDGRFPPYADILSKTNRTGTHELRVALCPQLLTGLLATIRQFNDEDYSSRAEFVIRFDVPEPAKQLDEEGDQKVDPETGIALPDVQPPIVIEHPILVIAKNRMAKFTGLIMPLAG